MGLTLELERCRERFRPAVFVRLHSNESVDVWRMGSIKHILAACGRPEIASPIVNTIPVDVIHDGFG